MPDRPLPDAATAKEWWAAMLLIRRFEERAALLYEEGRIGGFLHRAVGEEATVVGALRMLWEDDAALSTFRAHAHALARGTPVGALFAELLGRVDGVCGGRGGSTHMVDAARGVLGGWGIPGGHVAVGAGVALTGRVTLCQLTLGAVAEGVVSETLSLAAAWDLPLVLLVTNDEDAPSSFALTELFQRSASLGVAGLRCDGTDPIAVSFVVREALRRARVERRPTVAETLVRKQTVDPLETLAARLASEGAMTDDERDEIAGRVDEEIAAGVAFAEASPEPAAETLLDHVLAP